jgi:hypothetical protein
MAMEFVLINLDSGDVFFLGDQRKFRAVPKIGITQEHWFFDEIPNYDSAENNEGSKNFYRKSGHALNFFLTHSRGCRLLTLEANEVFKLIGEFEEEYPDSMISLTGRDGSDSTYYENRLRHIESVRPVTEEEKKAHADRALHYRNEIKEVFRKNIEKNKIGNPPILEIAIGNLPPNPVFTPWDG